MPQRFNAPPGWNVPPDFVPSADWQPDPSWPPAPEGWTYWVDDAAPAAPAYGQPPQGSPAYGDAPQAGAAYGSAPGSPYGDAPAGAYGSTDPGSAQLAVAQAQQSGAKRNMLIGVGVAAAAIIVWVVSYSLAGPGDRYFAPWYFVLIGIVLAIRGLIEMNKAKKALAAAQGPYGGYAPQGVTPPGQNPPGTF